MNRRLLPYFLVVSVVMMAMGGIFTLLGELRDQLGFSETGLGLMVAMGFFSAFGAQIGLSRFADRGYTAIMARFGLVTIAVAVALMAVATELWQFVLLRMVLGMAVGSLLPSFRRLVIISDPANVGANLGAMGAFDVGGFLIGPLITALIAEFFGFRAPFIVLAALTLCFLPLVFSLPTGEAPPTEERKVVRVLLASTAIKAMLVSSIGWFAMIGVFEAVWAIMLTDRGAETWLVGLTMSLIMVPMLFLAPLTGTWAQRRGPLRMAMLGVLIVAPLFVSHGFIDSLLVVTIVATCQGAGDALVLPSGQVGLAMAAPEKLAASAQGLYGATLELSAGTVALFAGAVYERWGAETLFAGVGGLMLCGVACAWLLARTLPADHPVLVGAPAEPSSADPALAR